MPLPDLRADCSRCAALCCVAFAFDRSAEFGFDKPAATPCRHLGGNDRCRIHGDLHAQGFSGCVAYDCHGAGQRVVQEVFDGRSWREDPALAREMFDAFRALRKIHEWLLLLGAATRLPLDAEEAARRAALEAALTPAAWTPASLAAFERGTLGPQVRAFLHGLRRHIANDEAVTSRTAGRT
ncbi:MAG TPA: hypothetical protein VMH86_17440 [Rhizomicrobium sp.]|nr:hypothetical protein [Rhizomicrobium sp.]